MNILPRGFFGQDDNPPVGSGAYSGMNSAKAMQIIDALDSVKRRREQIQKLREQFTLSLQTGVIHLAVNRKTTISVPPGLELVDGLYPYSLEIKSTKRTRISTFELRVETGKAVVKRIS